MAKKKKPQASLSNSSGTSNTAQKKKAQAAQTPLPNNNAQSTSQRTKRPPRSRQGSQSKFDAPGPLQNPNTPSKAQKGNQQNTKASMAQSTSPALRTTPISPKQNRRFFGAVILLHALDPVRGDRRSRPKVADPDELASDLLLDKFLDSVAYACDRKKGGKTVTAAALQKHPEGPILLLGSNSPIEPETIEKLREILDRLKAFKFGQESEKLLEEDIVRKLTYLGAERLKVYQKKAKQQLELTKPTFQNLSFISTCFLKHLQTVVNGEVLDDLVRNSYTAIKHRDMKHLLTDHENHEPNSKTVSDIRHFIGRMGSYVSVAKTFIRTARTSRDLIAELRIEVIPSPPPQPAPLLPGSCNLNSIISKVCQQPDVLRYTKLLNDHNSNFELNIPERLKANCSVETYIHAELILIDYFRTNDLDFHNPHRRYIGCSKDACYLCDQYVAAIRSPKFELRGCHQKIYTGWRPPDIPFPCEQARFLERRNILNKMMEGLRGEIMDHLDRGEKRRQSHPDSTTGVSMAPPFAGSLGQAFLDARRGSQSSGTLGFTESDWGEEFDGRIGIESEWGEKFDGRTGVENESGDESDGGGVGIE